jgi:glucose-6-phosphate-specific signal transduction histidine kinase
METKMDTFAQFIPLLLLIAIVAPSLRYGWRVSWVIAVLGAIPLINMFVIYFVGKQINSRIDALEEQLAQIGGKPLM